MKPSLRKSSLRTQISASYALMAVLPILALGYLIWSYVDPEFLSQTSLLIVVYLTVTISLFGFFLLRQVVSALSDFREHLKSVVEDRVLDTPISSDEPTTQPAPESIEEIVYNLIKHNSRLSDMFSDMEEATWSKTRELTRVNVELQRQLQQREGAEVQLRKSNMQLSDALEKLKGLQQCMIRHERLSALGQLASGVAHDINNALMPVIGFSELIIKDQSIADDKPALMDMITDILEGAQQAAAVVRKLKDFYRKDSNLNFSEVDTAALIAEVKELTKPLWGEKLPAEGKHIDFDVDASDAPPFQADPHLLRDAMVNIVMNSLDAMPTGGTVAIRASQADSQVVITIKDDGCGMSKYDREHAMEPFFTTKSKEATGMGLAIAFGTVRRHSGTIEIDASPGQGTEVTIHLPLTHDEEDIPGHEPNTQPSIPPLNILVIDDDSNARKTLDTILSRGKHKVTLAATATIGIAQAKDNDFDVVITDRAMPDLSGDDVALQIHQNKPDLPIIMVTGFGDMMHEQHEMPPGVSRIVAKPVDAAAIKWAIFDVTQ